jgi:hypothetical protein
MGKVCGGGKSAGAARAALDGVYDPTLYLIEHP